MTTKITVAKSAGFCFGVKKSITKAIDIALKENKPIYTLGELIHNSIVIDSLMKRNIIPIKSIDELPNGSILVIRTHGVSKEVIQELKKRKIDYFDATCSFVKKIHKIVNDEYLKGNQIIITGEKTHPEVIGINGWCNNSALIFSDIPKNYIFDQSKKYVVVSQTTFSSNTYNNIYNYLINNIKFIEFYNTICYTTKDRQIETEELAKNNEYMLVLGDKNSSNTKKLVDVANKYCENTYLISHISDLDILKNKKINTLGITAGASTPDELMQEVVEIMGKSQIEKGDVKNIMGVSDESNNFMANAVEKMPKNTGKRVVPGRVYKLNIGFLTDNDTNILLYMSGQNIEAKLPVSDVIEEGKEFNFDEFKQQGPIRVMLNKVNNDWVASRKEIVENEKKVNELLTLIENNEPFDVVVDSVAQKDSGLIAKFGKIELFIPASHIELRPVKRDKEKLSKYIGKTLTVYQLPDMKPVKAEEEKVETPVADENSIPAPEVIPAVDVVEDATQENEVKKNKRISLKNLKASRKVYLIKQLEKKDEAFWSVIEVGQVVKGKVLRFQDFGVFVRVMEKDCLCRTADLAWYRIESPAEILELNKSYEFVVLSLDREHNRVGLGYKQLQKKPYEIAAEQYPVGSVVKGTIERIFPYGMFVKIAKGVDGLVPIKEVAYEFIEKLEDYKYKQGDEIEVKVIDINDDKFTFSIKALLEPPVVEKKEEVEDDALENEVVEASAKKKIDHNKFDLSAKPVAKKSRSKKSTQEDTTEHAEDKNWTDDSEQHTATFGDMFSQLMGITKDEKKETKSKSKKTEKVEEDK